MPLPHYRIDVLDDLTRPERQQLTEFLLTQFDRVEGEHPASQAMTSKETETIFRSPETFVIACWEDDDKTVGATVVTTDLSSVAWVSKRFFHERYAREAFGDIPLFFITSMAVAPGAPAQVLNGMIDRLTDIVAEAGGVAVADLADRGRSHSLARHIAGRVATRYESDWQALGTQTYHAFRPGKPVEKILWSHARRLVADKPVGPGSVRD